MRKTSKLMSVMLAALLLMSLTLGIARAEVPKVPMTVWGYVYLETLDPAPAGMNVYAKYGGTEIASCTTTAEGKYALQLEGPAEGASIDLWVETENVETITLSYMSVLEKDLILTAPQEPDTGTLSIDTSPVKGAVLVNGASWGTAPQSQVVAVGSYMVSFGAVAGYTTPASQTAVVTKDATKAVMGTYVAITGDTGTLSIDTSPVKGAVLVNGASWGTAPQSQVVAVGSYMVSFGAVAGYTTPASQTAVVTKDATKAVMGTYVFVVIPTGDLITKIQYFDDPDWIDWAAPVLKGDTIRVVGKGVTAGATINVYWDNAMKETYTAGSGKVASGTAKSSGTFSIKFVVPEGLVGSHYIWVKDVATGKTDSIAVSIASKLTASPSSGLEGDTVTLTGYGYGYDEDNDKGLEVTINLDSFLPKAVASTPAKPKTSSLGTWTATFKVPEIGYGEYYVYAHDYDGNEDADGVKFTVGASITLSISEGPVGSVVTITGRGFEKDEALTVNIGGDACYILSGDKVRSDGRISAKIVIPYEDLGDEESIKYTVTVKDATGGLAQNSATAKFTVNGEAEVKATPAYGVQGAKVTVEGWNFTKISGTEVLVTLGGVGDKTFKTDSSGYFKGTFQLPAVAGGDSELKAAIGKHYIVATSTVRVGVMLVILTPDLGPSGALISVTGVGFEPGSAYTVKIGDDEWFTGTTEGTISESLNVPSMDPGTYTVTVIEDESKIEVTATLTVTEKTKVELSPAAAPNEYQVTIEGWYFAESPEDASVEFVLYNATSEWIIPVTYKMDDTTYTVELCLDKDWDDGYFKGNFMIPEEDSISNGSYTLNVTDGMGMFAQITVQVVPKTTTITPRKATFRIGETVAFNVESSFKQENAYIKIMDPSGNQYWRTDAFDAGKWTKIGNVQVYPFYQQTAGGNAMYLMEDAPLGTYTWKWYDKDAELLDSGSFTVAAATESLLGQQITDLNTAVTGLTSDITTVTAEVAAVRTQITNSINAANAAVQAANEATQAVNAVAQTANAASQAATNAATAATQAQKAAEGLTTLVYGAIGASLVAALAAIVSLMQISRRIAG